MVHVMALQQDSGDRRRYLALEIYLELYTANDDQVPS